MAKSAAPKCRFHFHANGLLQDYVHCIHFSIQFYVYESTNTDKMYILHQNSIWPYRHLNIMMNEYTPVSVYTCTQDFPNSLPNGTLFCYHFSTTLHAFFFSKSLPLHFNLKLFTEGKVRKDASSCDISNPAPFYKIHMSLHPRRVHKTVHDPFWLLHTEAWERWEAIIFGASHHQTAEEHPPLRLLLSLESTRSLRTKDDPERAASRRSLLAE